jgi:MFS family permease
VLLLIPSQSGVLAYVVLFGLGSGASTPVRAALVAEQYGTAAYGRINGALTMLGTWARVAAPVGAGALSLAIGYRPLLWGLAVAAAIAAACVWRAMPSGRHA